ncbi:MAG: Zn-ribbon domain-containing OB-fold protein [Candidatus Eisenbacteria bacterium]|nr:Zn-ribbon domain-containing OB-fold protein [Candidatus Eisenbacteria bacterium]
MSFQEQIKKTTSLGFFEGQVPLNYKYTMGVAGERFFQTLRDKGDFIASKCPECGTMAIYPLIYCEECFAEIKDYVSVGLTGELYSWTECSSDFKGARHEKPHLLGMVRFQGVQGGIIHRLDVPLSEIAIGMKVIAVLRPSSQRKGSLDDIQCFKKA